MPASLFRESLNRIQRGLTAEGAKRRKGFSKSFDYSSCAATPFYLLCFGGTHQAELRGCGDSSRFFAPLCVLGGLPSMGDDLVMSFN